MICLKTSSLRALSIGYVGHAFKVACLFEAQVCNKFNIKPDEWILLRTLRKVIISVTFQVTEETLSLFKKAR